MAGPDPMYWETPDTATLLWAAEAQTMGWTVTPNLRVQGDLTVQPTDPRSLEDRRAAALAETANLRWEASLACVWRGFTVPCDSQAAINVTGAIVGLQLSGSEGPIRWKTAAGFVSLTLAQIIDLGQTMRLHVQACFDNEAALAARILTAADAAALDAVDISAGWPQ